MAWGIPPKVEVTKKVEEPINEVKDRLIAAGNALKWTIKQDSDHVVVFYRPPQSFFMKYIYRIGGWTITARLTETGNLYLESRLDNTFTDAGSNKKNVENLLKHMNINPS